MNDITDALIVLDYYDDIANEAEQKAESRNKNGRRSS